MNEPNGELTVRLLLNSGDKRRLDSRVTIASCLERARDIAKDKEPATPRLPL